MHHQLQLAYLGIQVPDPSALTTFFGETIGLVPGAPGPAGTVTWRNDDKAHRVIVEPGPANDGVFVGFDAGDDETFDGLVARLDAVGFRTAEGSDDARIAVDAWRVPHPRGRARPRRVRHHRVRRVACLRHRRARHGADGPAGDGDRRGHRARSALLPLQPAPPHPRPGQGAVRAAPEAAPPDGRDEQA